MSLEGAKRKHRKLLDERHKTACTYLDWIAKEVKTPPAEYRVSDTGFHVGAIWILNEDTLDEEMITLWFDLLTDAGEVESDKRGELASPSKYSNHETLEFVKTIVDQ